MQSGARQGFDQRVIAPDEVKGQNLGVAFPTSVEPLRCAGPEFLTRAFHASGALSRDNRVLQITGFNEFFGGGMGRKIKLTVAYEHARPGLHNQLFVKFTLDFGNPLRALFAPIMEPETRFALLSMQPDFPIAVPRCYFADYDIETQSGILITECVAFGVPPNETFYDKCLDYRMPRPLVHYQALIRTVAGLAAAHKSGCFGAAVDRQFPFVHGQVREHDLIPYTATQLTEKIAALRAFVDRYPRLIPAEIVAPEFIERFAAEAQQYLQHERHIKRHLNSWHDGIALCHWNANVDNAWFFTDKDGALRAGLLDWGSVGQMNVAQSIFGVLCAVEVEFWDRHANELIALFAEEYTRRGGPALDVAELSAQTHLFVALLGIAWMIDAPAIIAAQLPGLAPGDDRFTPTVRDNFLARAQLHLLTVFLNAWRRGDHGALLREFLRQHPPA